MTSGSRGAARHHVLARNSEIAIVVLAGMSVFLSRPGVKQKRCRRPPRERQRCQVALRSVVARSATAAVCVYTRRYPRTTNRTCHMFRPRTKSRSRRTAPVAAFLLSLALAPAAVAETDVTAVQEAIDGWRADREAVIVEDFVELLSIPNV